jgi:hypothetical protein
MMILRKARPAALPVALAAGSVLLVAALFWMKMEDDAYIYLRFARNWITNGEIAFNPGRPLVGFTSLLQFLTVSLLALLFCQPDQAVYVAALGLHAAGWRFLDCLCFPQCAARSGAAGGSSLPFRCCSLSTASWC